MAGKIEFPQPQPDPALRRIEVPTMRGGNMPANATVSITIPDNLSILSDGQVPGKAQRCMRFITPKDGDKRIVWDCGNLNQIAEAKRMFDQAITQGLVPYRVGLNGQASSEVMDEFDPEAEEVFFMPIALVAGG